MGDWLLNRAVRGERVVRLRFGRLRLVYLLGPEANALVFGNDEWFRTREAFAALEIVDGPTSVVLSDGPEHARRRRLIRPTVAPRRIDGYLETMVEAADEGLAQIRPDRSFDAYSLFRDAIRHSTLRMLFGGAIARNAVELGEMLQPLLDLTEKLPPVLDWHRRVRSRAWRRAEAARTAVDEFVNDQIARERGRVPVPAAPGAEPSSEPQESAESPPESVLPLLVHGRDGTGSGLDDQEVRDQVVTMIAAGYETTSAAMGWIVYLLGAHPHWQRRCRDEIAAVLEGRPPGPGDLDALPLVQAVVTEALRLYPPAIISARHAVQAFSYGGEQVKPGDLVIFSPYVTHRDPNLYDDPSRFDPGRWIETPRRPPEEFLPFGGGKHRCLGNGLAMAELTVMTCRLLARGEFALDRAPARARGFAAMRPDPGVLVRMSGASG